MTRKDFWLSESGTADAPCRDHKGIIKGTSMKLSGSVVQQIE